jgi:hypothetical protein
VKEVTTAGADDREVERNAMTLHLVQLEHRPEHKSFRLTRGSGPTTTSQVRPDVVLPVDKARAVLTAAAQNDVAHGGAFSPGPAGVQVWSGAWNGPTGGPGTATHLGSIDWSYDTPVAHYVTIYRVMLTAAGRETGLTTDSLLGTVLALAGLGVPPVDMTTAQVPLPRDPFRSESWRPSVLTARPLQANPAVS